MDRQALIGMIAGADLDLRIMQNDASVDPETLEDVAVSRELLARLRTGVQQGEQAIYLGDSWPLSTIAMVLPVIGAVETQGISVLYMPAGARAA